MFCAVHRFVERVVTGHIAGSRGGALRQSREFTFLVFDGCVVRSGKATLLIEVDWDDMFQ